LQRWHRYFGLLLSDQLADSPFSVVLEMDLSHRKQLLDVVVVRRGPGPVTQPLPDGLDDLADHNLITFKSFGEALDDWTLKEPTGHYVNYRKQVSPRGSLLPEDQFRMIAVRARRPQNLFAAIPPDCELPGVYRLWRGTDAIRIVVAVELPKAERNALLHLFSAAPDQVEYGAEHYHMRSRDTSTVVKKLFKLYRVEGLPVPYTMQDFMREVALEHLGELTAEERLAGLPPEQRLAGLPPEQRLAGLSAEEVLKQFSPEEIESYLKRTAKSRVKASKKKPRRRR
jgi:hypothetical protein